MRTCISNIRDLLMPVFDAAYTPLLLCLLFFGLLNTPLTSAQEINFGDYSHKYSMTVTELNPAEDLNFGMLIQNEGMVELELSEAKVLEIEGVRYLDVLVDIMADEYLVPTDNPTCDVTECGIPFTLQSAYANRGQNNTGQAIIMNDVGANMTSAIFPIMDRGNRPPGPPPTPDHEGYNPSQFNETAYLYIYGMLNVGSVNAGSYSGQVTITLSYD